MTTSMLPFFMAVICALYFFVLRRWHLLPAFLLGLLIGLVPLFVYSAVSFGNPFLLPNVAGGGVFADTFFHFDARNLGNKAVFYATSVVAYVPIFAVGLLGLSYYPRRIKRGPEFVTLLAMLIALAAVVCNISSEGGCQFGPRYLLPAMPFACLGIAGYSHLLITSERRFAGGTVLVAGIVSFVVNLVGALRGAMNCPDGQNAFWNHVAAIQQGKGPSYPLAPWLLIPLLICAGFFGLRVGGKEPAQSPTR